MHFPTDTLIDCPHLTGKLLNLIYITTIIITLCMDGCVPCFQITHTEFNENSKVVKRVQLLQKRINEAIGLPAPSHTSDNTSTAPASEK